MVWFEEKERGGGHECATVSFVDSSGMASKETKMRLRGGGFENRIRSLPYELCTRRFVIDRAGRLNDSASAGLRQHSPPLLT